MLWEVFVLGGFLFWLLLAVELAFVVCCLHVRRGGLATVSMAGVLLLLWLFGNVNVFLWAWRNPGTFAWWAGGYMVLATVWGFAKWTMFMRDHSYRYGEIRNRFLSERKIEGDEIPAELKVVWQQWFNRNNDTGDWEPPVEFNPSEVGHKAMIIGWMVFWPVSLAWTLIDDAVIKFFRHLYYLMSDWLKGIRQYYWKRYENDMPTPEEVQQHYERECSRAKLNAAAVEGDFMIHDE